MHMSKSRFFVLYFLEPAQRGKMISDTWSKLTAEG